MKTILIAYAAIALSPSFPASGAQDSWTLILQQGNRKSEAPGTARFQRTSFSISFTGPKSMGFAVLAASTCNALEALKTSDQISEAIRPTNIAAEGPASENTFLIVNSASVFASGESSAHVWADDKENDIHSFQDLRKLGSEQMVSTRVISTITIQLGGGKSNTVATSKYPGSEICILATGLPPVGYMAHSEPKLFRVTFE